jgi:DNA-binding XRE family transcriptional regulator
MPITPAQCRAARALLDWTQDELAERAEVSRGTIRGFESGQHMLQRSTAAAVCRALVAGGVVLVQADRAAGPGVRFVEPAACAGRDGAGADEVDKAAERRAGRGGAATPG